MKKAILLAAILVLAMQMLPSTQAQAQEREPLVMHIELEWTLAGMVGGAVMGFMIWLTDPVGPLPLNDALASGAAWGAVAGAGYGVFMMQRTARIPNRFADGSGGDLNAPEQTRPFMVASNVMPKRPPERPRSTPNRVAWRKLQTSSLPRSTASA